VAVLAAQSRAFPNVGTPLAQAEIQGFDHMIGPDGKELPVGRGTSKEGAEIFAKRVRGLPRQEWRERDTHHLVAGSPGKPFRGPFYGVERTAQATSRIRRSRGTNINRAIAGQQSGIAQAERSLLAGRVPVLRNGIINETT